MCPQHDYIGSRISLDYVIEPVLLNFGNNTNLCLEFLSQTAPRSFPGIPSPMIN